MGLLIESGLGDGYQAGVNRDNRLMTAGRNNFAGHFVSRDQGLAFSANAHDATAAAGTHIFYFQNTSATRLFFVDLLRVGAVNTALWKVWSVTGTAAGGSAITPTNLNLSSGAAAEATSRGGDEITGLTQVSQISNIRTPGNDSREIPYDDILILDTNDAFAVEYDTGTTGIAEVFMRGYYETK